MSAELSVLVLAGGEARRLDGMKAERPLGRRRLVDGVLDVARALSDDVLLASRDRRLPAPGTRRIDDRAEWVGPLAGLAAGLAAARHAWCLLLPCDMPFASVEVVRRQAASRRPGDQAVAVHDGVRAQPFHALYARELLPVVERYYQRGGRSLLGVLEACGRAGGLRLVSTSGLGAHADGRFLLDVNTAAALRALHAIDLDDTTHDDALPSHDVQEPP